MKEVRAEYKESGLFDRILLNTCLLRQSHKDRVWVKGRHRKRKTPKTTVRVQTAVCCHIQQQGTLVKCLKHSFSQNSSEKNKFLINLFSSSIEWVSHLLCIPIFLWYVLADFSQMIRSVTQKRKSFFSPVQHCSIMTKKKLFLFPLKVFCNVANNEFLHCWEKIISLTCNCSETIKHPTRNSRKHRQKSLSQQYLPSFMLSVQKMLFSSFSLPPSQSLPFFFFSQTTGKFESIGVESVLTRVFSLVYVWSDLLTHKKQPNHSSSATTSTAVPPAFTFSVRDEWWCT